MVVFRAPMINSYPPVFLKLSPRPLGAVKYTLSDES
jgi:hypothetical protein